MTQNTPGMVDIIATILKDVQSAVFVADVTPIGKTPKAGTPQPKRPARARVGTEYRLVQSG
jgi:hypothetical protein